MTTRSRFPARCWRAPTGSARTSSLAIARTKSQAHLAAIAGRSALGEQVTDVLVERGDVTVARKVAANSGARFSEVSLRSLVDRASDDGDLAHAVARRREIAARDVPQPARARDRRGAQAADRHRQSGDREGDQQDPRGDLGEGRKPDRQPSATITAAKQAVMELQKQSGIAPATLVQFAKAQKLEETVVTLSLLTGVPIDVIDRFLDDPSDDPILILCKAIDLDWNTTAAGARRAARHDAIAREPRRGSEQEIPQAVDLFGAARDALLAGAREGGGGGVTPTLILRSRHRAREVGRLEGWRHAPKPVAILRDARCARRRSYTALRRAAQLRSSIPLVRQHRQRMKLDAFLVQRPWRPAAVASP